MLNEKDDRFSKISLEIFRIEAEQQLYLERMLRPPLGFVSGYGPAPPGHPALGALYPTLQPPPIALMSPVMHER